MAQEEPLDFSDPPPDPFVSLDTIEAETVEWLWPQRRKKQEIGALAAEALGRIGSPAAISALEAGKKRLNRFIRNACTDSLDAPMRSQQADR